MEKNKKIVLAQITNIRSFNADKNGKPLLTSQGKPYAKVSVKFDKGGDEFYYTNDFNGEMKEWKVGDQKTVELFEREWQGQWYKNFKVPDRVDLLTAKVDEIAKRLTSLENKNGPKTEIGEMLKDQGYPTDEEIDSMLIPF